MRGRLLLKLQESAVIIKLTDVSFRLHLPNDRRLQNASSLQMNSSSDKTSVPLVMIVSFEAQISLSPDDASLESSSLISTLTSSSQEFVRGLRVSIQAQMLGAEILGFEKPLVVEPSSLELAQFDCTRGLQCSISVRGSELFPQDLVVVIPAASYCGVTPEWTAEVLVGTRATNDFTVIVWSNSLTVFGNVPSRTKNTRRYCVLILSVLFTMGKIQKTY